MDLHRKAYEKLRQWKNSKKTSKAILIKGARRVGKSYLAEHFAQNEYKSYILIDFASPKNGTLKIFENYGNKDSLNDFFNQVSVLYGIPLKEHESVFIFDEIQKYPKARELIKYLVADGRYDYIETGSLISIKKNVKDIVIPSEEEQLELHPLDFEEFLLALSDTVTIPFLKTSFENKKPLGNMLKPIMTKFRNYMIVGGMPQAVAEYAESGNIDNVEKIKRGIINLYREDIAKYAESYVAEATAIFNSIPALLAHHDKKIKYSSLGEGDRFTSYKDAIHWISDSMVGSLCMGTDAPDIFAGFTVQTSKLKCYMEDTGILLTLAAGENYLNSELYKSFMLGKISVNKGMMTENMIAQIFTSNSKPLRFYENIVTSDSKKLKYEVDFLIRDGDKVVPIEVKSGNIKEHRSLDYYQKKFKSFSRKGIVLTKGDLQVTDDYLYLPLFMAIFL
ncbi:MAG: AAA family ATPase [Treponema sp.]|nr:AAA family ATPase [Treponema sp.]